jgi:hypothetical protein
MTMFSQKIESQNYSIKVASNVQQGCINPGFQVAQATKWYRVVPNVCGC